MDFLDTSMRACLTTTFFTLVQAREFTVTLLDSFDPAIHIKCSDVKATVAQHNNHATVFSLPCTKCLKDGKDVYCAAQPGTVNPISELKIHISVNNLPANGHLFTYIYTGSHPPLTKNTFLNWLNTIAVLLGLKSLKGHAVHINGTLEYLLWGVPFNIIKSMGQWLSDAFTLYLCMHTVM